MKQERSFDFSDLVVFDLANNHQGSVEHGRSIIRAMGEVSKSHHARAAIKFQFRQLDTFIHPGHVNQSDNKHIGRFVSTRLERTDFEALLGEVQRQEMLAMCTPFDEESVDVIVDMGFDIVKIASCSAADWPLVEKVAHTGLPVVVSTGGLELTQIDDLNSFFQHRGVDFAIMHCVSIYPTPADRLNLNQIDLLRARFPEVPIGWSTHEDPDSLGPAQVAIAKGAQLLERHVGIETDEIKLNAYSSTPEQIDRWLGAVMEAKAMCGSYARPPVPAHEAESIASLQRGIYLREPVTAGSEITRDMVYFAMPISDGQIASGTWREHIEVLADLPIDAPLKFDNVAYPPDTEDRVIRKANHEVRAMLNQAKVQLSSDFEIEYSHHYGVENFRKIGAVIINIINRSYCKKIIVQLPGQLHPQHFHKRKEETFQVLDGVLNLVVEGHKRTLYPGDTCLIQPGTWHSFWTEMGCVFEEISTRHYNDDSFYKDKKINDMARAARKTIVNHWGRFELPEKIHHEPGVD